MNTSAVANLQPGDKLASHTYEYTTRRYRHGDAPMQKWEIRTVQRTTPTQLVLDAAGLIRVKKKDGRFVGTPVYFGEPAVPATPEIIAEAEALALQVEQWRAAKRNAA